MFLFDKENTLWGNMSSRKSGVLVQAAVTTALQTGRMHDEHVFLADPEAGGRGQAVSRGDARGEERAATPSLQSLPVRALVPPSLVASKRHYLQRPRPLMPSCWRVRFQMGI